MRKINHTDWGKLQSMERNPCRSRFSVRSWDLWGNQAGVFWSWKPVWSWKAEWQGKGPTLELFLKTCGFLGRVYVGEVWERLYPFGGTWHCSRGTAWEGGHGRGISVVNWPQSPFPIPSVLLRGEREEDSGVKNSGICGEVGKNVFFCFALTSHYPTLVVNWQKN